MTGTPPRGSFGHSLRWPRCPAPPENSVQLRSQSQGPESPSGGCKGVEEGAREGVPVGRSSCRVEEHHFPIVVPKIPVREGKFLL